MEKAEQLAPNSETNPAAVLAINRGSSSLKCAVYSFAAEQAPRLLFRGRVDRIGQPGALLEASDVVGRRAEKRAVEAGVHGAAAGHLLDWLDKHVGIGSIRGVGHRVVHGGPHYWQPERVTPELLEELRRISPFDPDHLPTEIGLIEWFQRRYPDLPQVACFDTGFHHDMPRVARVLPIPRRFDRLGVERYGFHGLSYAFLLEELARQAGAAAAQGRAILAHLGAGASLAAVRDGKSVDTSMGFTPTAGLPMATRSGDLDPGLVWFLARTEGMTAEQFHDMVNHESGLLGVSESSGDVRDLFQREAADPRAGEALAVFCYQVKKWIGAFAAALGGLETLVFSGGIGETSPPIRARVCGGLGLLGIELDAARNAANASLVSADSSRVAVRVIRTDEEIMIARAAYRVLAREVCVV